MTPAVPEASLTALMQFLAEMALLCMGGQNPMTKEPLPANPAMARFYVDLLSVLKEKTGGSRTEAETAQLEEILYQLRMRVMDLKPAADMPAAPKS